MNELGRVEIKILNLCVERQKLNEAIKGLQKRKRAILGKSVRSKTFAKLVEE